MPIKKHKKPGKMSKATGIKRMRLSNLGKTHFLIEKAKLLSHITLFLEYSIINARSLILNTTSFIRNQKKSNSTSRALDKEMTSTTAKS
jgi:hypothetical protein